MNKLKLSLKNYKYYLTNNIITLQDVSKSFNKVSNYSSTYLNEITYSSIPMLDEIINKLKHNSSRSLNVLDLGSGMGFNCIYLNNNLKYGNYTLVDISPGMIAKSKKNCDFNCTFIENDILSYLNNCNDNSMDVIISSYSISYNSPKEIIKECCRVLKNGGYFGVIDTLKGSLPELQNIDSKIITNHYNLLNKSYKKLNHFRYEYYFEKIFVDNRFNRIKLLSDSIALNFINTSNVHDFISFSGILSPLDCVINLQDSKVKSTLTNLINTNNITLLTHKYIWGTFRNDK